MADAKIEVLPLGAALLRLTDETGKLHFLRLELPGDVACWTQQIGDSFVGVDMEMAEKIERDFINHINGHSDLDVDPQDNNGDNE